MTGADRKRRRNSRPSGLAILSSLALHGLVIAVFWIAGLTYAAPLPPMKTYKVNIVSPPPVEAGPMREAVPEPTEPPLPVEVELPVEEPPPVVVPEPQSQDDQTLPKSEPKREDPPETEVREEPPKREPEREQEKREEKPRPTPPREATGQNPDPDATESGSGMNIKIEGEVFPYPDYLEQIAIQIGRYFRWTGDTGLSAEIYFEIMRDGSVREIRLLRGSGSAAFNFEAMGAIEQAGRRRAFGPLPDGYTGDHLPVSFYFQPAR